MTPVIADTPQIIFYSYLSLVGLLLVAGVGCLFAPRWRRLGICVLVSVAVCICVPFLSYFLYPFFVHRPPETGMFPGLDYLIGRLVCAFAFSVIMLCIGWIPAWLWLRKRARKR
jgi:hypothetical protein